MAKADWAQGAWRGADGKLGEATSSKAPCMHSKRQDSPWWQVDLGSVQNVTSVVYAAPHATRHSPLATQATFAALRVNLCRAGGDWCTRLHARRAVPSPKYVLLASLQ